MISGLAFRIVILQDSSNFSVTLMTIFDQCSHRWWLAMAVWMTDHLIKTIRCRKKEIGWVAELLRLTWVVVSYQVAMYNYNKKPKRTNPLITLLRMIVDSQKTIRSDGRMVDLSWSLEPWRKNRRIQKPPVIMVLSMVVRSAIRRPWMTCCSIWSGTMSWTRFIIDAGPSFSGRVWSRTRARRVAWHRRSAASLPSPRCRSAN